MKHKSEQEIRGTSLASSTQDECQSQKQSVAENALTHNPSFENQTEKTRTQESGSDGADVSKGRPMSPSTLALMCDEQDTVFSTDASPNRLEVHNNLSSQLPLEQGMTEAYAEQERIVLTKFRDCLNRLITLGEIKETKYSSLARTVSANENDLTSNDTSNVRTETRNQQLVSNGVSIHPQRASAVVTQTASAVHNIPSIRTITPAENGDVRTKRERDL
ncbi:UNVERIFIED_CONTAM: protein tesmin/TSO1-like CXC 5 [Sesamum radiatum]|uniref:Protein tesmin/TSO1-like CXC 5 n=1 Tax=Sesamum radiatum TaxID=300843 RepID=A0AAW2KSH2_SESRA